MNTLPTITHEEVDVFIEKKLEAHEHKQLISLVNKLRKYSEEHPSVAGVVPEISKDELNKTLTEEELLVLSKLSIKFLKIGV